MFSMMAALVVARFLDPLAALVTLLVYLVARSRIKAGWANIVVTGVIAGAIVSIALAIMGIPVRLPLGLVAAILQAALFHGIALLFRRKPNSGT